MAHVLQRAFVDIGRVVEQQPLDAARLGLLVEGQQFADMVVPAGDHGVGGGDEIEDRLDLVGNLAVGAEQRERRRSQRLLRRDREFGVELRVGLVVVEMVVGMRRRHPDDAGALLQRIVDGRGVDAAERIVEHDRAQHLHALGDVRIEDRGQRHGRVIVILEQDRGKAGLVGLSHGLDMVDLARHQRGTAVDVEVDCALEQSLDAGVLRRCNCVVHDHSPAMVRACGT